MTNDIDGPTRERRRRDVGVLGGGRMGAGIAHAFLLAGVARHGRRARRRGRGGRGRRACASRVEASIARGTADDDAATLALALRDEHRRRRLRRLRPRGRGGARGPRAEDRRPHPRRGGARAAAPRSPRTPRRSRSTSSPRCSTGPTRFLGTALLQPGAGVDARRDRARRRDRRRARRRGPRVGRRDRQDPDRRARRARLRLVAARRRPRARGDPHARRGRRQRRGHRRRDDARLPASGRPAAARPTSSGLDVRLGIAEYLHADARRAVRAARPAAPHGRRGQARPQERRGLLSYGRTTDDRHTAQLRRTAHWWTPDAAAAADATEVRDASTGELVARVSAPRASTSAPRSSTRAPSGRRASAR